MSELKTRIVGEGTEQPDQLLANPFNYRRHPKEQLDALEGALQEIGWIQRVIVNQQTGHLVDGHARVELAIRRAETEVPVIYVDLTEQEERVALATIDPIAGLAYHDEETLAGLLEGLEVENESLAEFLADMNPDKEGQSEEIDQDLIRATLNEQFIVPPFSVLDARQGYWQDRKRLWLALGIRSEEGRGQDGDKSQGGLTFSVACQPPSVHDRKREIEQRDGATYTWAEFAEEYPEELSLAGDSVFDPVLTEISYRWFCPPGGEILDPFAGGSVRGVVAAMLGYNYTGVELRDEQVRANRSNWLTISGKGAALAPRETPADNTPTHTPIEQHGENWAKRDDQFVFAGSRGGKVRSCLAISEGAQGLVTAGSRHSPQANIVAGIAQAKGIPARVHVPAGDMTPELLEAKAAGAEIVQHRPGYNSVIVARAREDAAERGWVEVPFGMECAEAVQQTRKQVEKMPKGVKRIVVAVGSGMTLAGILHGLRDTGQDIPVLGIKVGADPEKRLNEYAPEGWKDQVTLKKSGTPYEKAASKTEWNGIILDPHYEAKAAPKLKPGDLFWIVGRRQSQEPVARERKAKTRPKTFKLSANWATSKLDCTLKGITRAGGCGGACCHSAKYWPPKSNPDPDTTACAHLGEAGCTLAPEDMPIKCLLYPLVPNKKGTLVQHYRGRNSTCKPCVDQGPPLIDAMKDGLTQLFGAEQYAFAREEVSEGRDVMMTLPPAMAYALEAEQKQEENNEIPIPRSQYVPSDLSTESIAEPGTGADAKGSVEWIAGDSRELEKHIKPEETVDLIFSCPPYADLEVYSNDPADISNMGYDQFLEVYREIIAKACQRLRDNRFAVWVVGEVRGGKHGAYRNFVSDTIQAFEDAGLRYYNEAILVTATGSLALRAGHIFRAARKIGKGHQNVLVFTKGEAAGIDPITGLGNHIAGVFEQHRRLLETHEKVLVFAKGDPHQATDDLGEPMIADPEFFEELLNEPK